MYSSRRESPLVPGRAAHHRDAVAREVIASRPKSAAERLGVLPRPLLAWNADVERRTAGLYERVAAVMPRDEWPVHAPLIDAIGTLKRKRNAVILAHNYQNVEIYHCIADFMGDSLQLSRQAANAEADIIIQCGVHFMAETSKLLNPEKVVLIPDREAGCSLAASITAADVVALKEKHPGVPVVSYVNTSAAVKAQSDICCTSSNAVAVVESLGAPSVIFLPDRYLAHHVATQTGVHIIPWPGGCEVHERFTRADILEMRRIEPGITVLAHPECLPEVLAEADFTGSTAQMSQWITSHRPDVTALITECSMASNVALEAPGTRFRQPCHLCPHMQRITLPKIMDSLLNLEHEITIDLSVVAPARRAVERMIALPS